MKNKIKPVNNFIYKLAKNRNTCAQILEEVQWLYPEIINLSVTQFNNHFDFTSYSANIALDYNLVSSGFWVKDRTINWNKTYETLKWVDLDSTVLKIKLPPGDNYFGESHMFFDHQYGLWIISLIISKNHTNTGLERAIANEIGVYLFKNLERF